MRKMLTVLVCSLVLASVAHAQPARMSANAWQQKVKYEIETTLDTTAHALTSYMVLRYRNNSPDTLRRIYLQVPANAFQEEENTAVREMRRFRNGNIRFDQRRGHKLTVQSLQFFNIGSRAEFPLQAFNFSDTILDLPLPVALLPGDSLALGVSFVQDFNDKNGHNKRRNLPADFVLWFPLVAVYDSSGWHREPFHFMMDDRDVFSEFAEMAVTITVPGNFIVIGSGEVVAGDPGWSAVTTDTSVDSTAFVAWHDSLQVKRRAQAQTSGPRRVRFHAQKLRNFIWSASPNFIRFLLETSPAVEVFCRGVKNRGWVKDLFEKYDFVAEHIRRHYGNLPWGHLSIVQHRGPTAAQPTMIILDDAEEFSLAFLLSNMYVPGVVGTNGVDEAWLASGLAVYMGKHLAETKYGKQGYEVKEAREDMSFLERQYPLPTLDNVFRNFSRMYMDSGQNEPIANAIYKYKDPIGTGFNVYLKSEIFFEMLRFVVGDSLFKASLQEFVHQYAYRHAGEKELRAVCEKVAGQDLGWFFDQWLHGTPVVDYEKGQTRQYQRPDKTWVTEVEVRRKGDGIMPVEVAIDLGHGQTVQKRWDGKGAVGTVTFETPTKPRGLKVDPDDRIMDTNLLNNGKPRLDFKPDLPFMKFIYIPNDGYLVLWRPLIDYNRRDGLVLGLRTRSSYRVFFNNLTLEAMYGFLSRSVDGKIGYTHPLRRSNLMNRYSLMARKSFGRYETDAHLEFAGSKGIISTTGTRLTVGVNYSGVTDRRYTYHEVASDSGKLKFDEWDDVDVLLAYTEGRLRLGTGKLLGEARLRAESALPVSPGRDRFSKISGKIEGEYQRFGLMTRIAGNGAGSLGPDRLPLQDQFRAEGAAPRERFQNDIDKTGGEWQAFSHRYVEGGGNLRGYAGMPLPAAHYATLNFEFGPSSSGGLRLFGFYDTGKVWADRHGTPLTRADAGFGLSFLGGKSRLFGGNLALFEGLSARLYLPIWLSNPLPGEKSTQFRWYFSFGKQL